MSLLSRFRQGRISRAAWGLTDQGLSSLTNFTCSILAARSATLDGFGGFALAMSVYFLAAGLGQAIAGQPFTVRYAGKTVAERRTAAPRAAGVALALGLALGAAAALISPLFPKSVEYPLLALGILLPGLLLQDFWRYYFLADARPDKAVANDGVWAIVQFAASGSLLIAGRTTPTTVLMAWGLAANVAALVGFLQTQLGLSFGRRTGWIREHRSLIAPYFAESLVVRGSMQVALVLVSALSGIGALGALRAAQVLFNPLNLAYQGALFVAVPEGVRELTYARSRFPRLVQVVSAIAAAAAIVWSLILLVVPSGLGRELMGGIWLDARPLMLMTALYSLGVALTMGPQVGLRALGAAGWSFRIQLLQASLTILGAAIGAILWRAAGAAEGLAAGSIVGAAVWWAVVVRSGYGYVPDGRPEANPSLSGPR